MNDNRRSWWNLIPVGDWLLAFSLIAGFVVRLRMYISNPSYWYDEAYLLINLMKRSYLELIGQAEFDQIYPPLFAFVARFLYSSFGPNEMVMRLPALLASLLTLIVVACLTRRILPWYLAWLPVALLACSRHGIIHSCELKHYAFDLLAQSLILGITLRLGDERLDRWKVVALLLLAVAAPWLSFPAAFALGGTSAALVYRASCTRARSDVVLWIGFSLLVLVSGVALWFFHARTLQSPSLQQFWLNPHAKAYPNPNSLISQLFWSFQVLLGVGGYCTREMGLPLMLLSLLGGLRLFRTHRHLAIHLLVLFLLAVFASYLRRYPLTERTSFFLVIALVITAAVGVQTLWEWFSSRKWLLLLVAVTLLSVDAIWFVRSMITPPSYVPFRQVFDQLRTQRQPDDLVWVSHPEVYRVYEGLDSPVFSAQMQMADAAITRPGVCVWLIYLPGPYDLFTIKTQQQLSGLGLVMVEEWPVRNEIRVQRWAPAK